MPAYKSDDDYVRGRAEALRAIVASSDHRKVIAAGPGTGKTYTFEQVLKDAGKPALVLTFIRTLVADLERELGHLADVMTFHGFARWLLHSQHVIPGVHYFPLLEAVAAADMQWIGPYEFNEDDIRDSLHTLDEGHGALRAALRSSRYYRAVGHDLAVYAVLKHLQTNTQVIPKYAQVVVDEYQDFNALEVELIDVLATVNRVLVAGDDDQALYDFKLATPDFLRQRVASAEWAAFSLPFCSRCPPVVVEAVHRIVAAAQKRGLLKDRLDKPFECYLPEKRAAGALYPRILHARCSVHSKKAPYMARYIEQQIKSADPADIAEARDGRIPLALIIGPAFITRSIFEYLHGRFENVQMKVSHKPQLDILEGYVLLASDPKSRLGWRIVTMFDSLPNLAEILEAALNGDAELIDVLPSDYVAKHLEIVKMLIQAREGETLSEERQARLEEAVGASIEVLAARIGLEEAAESATPDATESAKDEFDHLILVTGSLLSSKGLEGQHVFILGVHAGSLPSNKATPTEAEVCQFLVALTRARKSCHIVTANHLLGKKQEPSPFLGWLGNCVEHIYVNKGYMDQLPK